jgi:hypothetical protein
MKKNKKDEELEAVYEKEMGKPPDNRYFDDPDWLYRGSKEEREELRRQVEQTFELDEEIVE